MNVIFYNISAPPEKVVKITNQSGTTITGVVFMDDGTLDILNPSIKLKMETEVAENLKFNYCHIPKTGRYYYISKIRTEAGLMIYDLTCDVLQSWSSDILESTQYVIRSEIHKNRLLVDSLLPLHSDHNLLVEPFGSDVFVKNCDHVILETIGKGGTTS